MSGRLWPGVLNLRVRDASYASIIIIIGLSH